MHASRRRKKRTNYGVRSVELARGRQGFGFTISGQQPCILSCIVPGSPAERAGLRAGDYLVSANGQGVGRTPHDEVVRLIGSARGTLRLQIAESYYSDSSDDEGAAARRPKPRGKPRPTTAQNRAAKVIRDLHTGAMFGEEGAVPPPARPRPPAAGADGCLLRCLVGYLGTIEMPRDLQPGSRLQVVRSCIRRLGGERGAATPVLLEAAPRWLALANAAGRALARLPGARVAFASRDARAFALVTAGPGAASACHVFSLEPAAHERHAARAAAFQLECSRSSDSSEGCAEFPADALGLVARFQALARAPSPAPSSRSSSNSDSGVGFREAASAAPERILVVDVRNQRLLVHAPGTSTPGLEYDTASFPLPAFGLGAFHSLPAAAASHLAGTDAHHANASTYGIPNDSTYSGANDSTYSATNDSKYSVTNMSTYSLGNDSTYSVSKDTKYSVGSDMKYSAVSDSKFSAVNDSKYSVANDSKFSAANDSKFSVTNDSKFSAANDSKYSVANDSKFSAANDSKYSVANVSTYSLANDSTYSVPNEAKYSVANVSSYSAAIDSTYSVANNTKYSIANARTYSVANARTYSVASTYDLPSVPLSSNVATSYDLPNVPQKHEAPSSVVSSYDLPNDIQKHEISASVKSTYRPPSVAKCYTPTVVTSSSRVASVASLVSQRAASPDVSVVSATSCEAAAVSTSPSEASSVVSPETARLTVRAMRDPLPASASSSIGSPQRSMGSQDSVRSGPQPMGSQDSLRSGSQPMGSQDSVRSGSQPMGSQDSVRSVPQPVASQGSADKGRVIGSSTAALIQGAGSSPCRPRLWGSMQELSTSRRLPDLSPSGGEEEEEARVEGEGGPAAWATSFERLLEDPVGMDAFSEFLKKEFSHENIAFYASCERFRRAADEAGRRATAADIFARHLAPTASEPVNVDAAARQVSPERLRLAPPDLFTSAQKQIFNLMKFDSYPRFLKSTGYQQCVDRAAEAAAAESAAAPNSASAKLKKSRSDAEERRRRSLLPWQRRGRSQSRDRSDEGGGAWDMALRGAHSRQSLGGDTSHLSDKECPGLCRVTLPDGATTVLRPRPGEHIGELVHRLLERRGLSCPAFTAFLDDHAQPLRNDTDCANLRGRRLLIERAPIANRPRPTASLDEITNRVFEELLRGKDAATPAAPCSVKSEDWGSEHSSGILGRFLRRDSGHDKHRESRSKKKAVKVEPAVITTTPASPVDPLLSPDLFEGLKRAQRSRLEDQRGTEINFELPDFLKDKENACRAKPAPLETDVDAPSPPYSLLREAVSGPAVNPTSPPPPPLPPKPRLAPRAPLNWPRPRPRPHGRAVADVTNHAADARAMPPPAARACRGRHRAVYLDQPTSSFV